MFEIGSNKKVLIIVPHQDDEINLMGGLLPLLLQIGLEVNVCYTTNGDFEIAGEIRLKEALNALQCLGIRKEYAYFLGYPDGSNKLNHSLYKSEVAVVSKKGAYTYGCLEKEEYRMLKSGHHSLNVYSSLKEDLKGLIEDIMPDILFCIDLDAHHDHIMTSLTFEKIICEIISQNDGYCPLVYKGFAYATTYEGKPDFFKSLNLLPATNNHRSRLGGEKSNENTANPCLKWQDRVRFPVLKDCITRNSFSNPIIEAMFKHKSQEFSKRICNVVNSDVVFWEMPLGNEGILLLDSDNIDGANTVFVEKRISLFRCFDRSREIRICKILLNDAFTYGEYYISNDTSMDIDIYRYNYDKSVQYNFQGGGVYIDDSKIFIPLDLDEVEVWITDVNNKTVDKVKIVRKNTCQRFMMYAQLNLFKFRCWLKRKFNS